VNLPQGFLSFTDLHVKGANMEPTAYQLKYCERCGSLRLRPADSAENYCQPCEQALFNWSLPEETVRLLLRKVEPLCGRERSGSPQAKSRASARDLDLSHGRLQ
jgi:hypothetical protein